MINRIFFVVVAAMMLGSCMGKIEITPEYVLNENWNEKANAIAISAMKLKKDSLLNLDSLNQPDILAKLEIDSSFIYLANVEVPRGRKHAKSRIYFNRDNGFYWLSPDYQQRKKILGPLNKEVWYKFSHLVTYPYFIYIYIDSTGKVHRFDVNQANF